MSPVSSNSLQLYENFVEEVDAVDNGISQCDGEARYAISTMLSARVGHLNPRWNSKSQDTEVRDCMTLNVCLHLAHRPVCITLIIYLLN